MQPQLHFENKGKQLRVTQRVRLTAYICRRAPEDSMQRKSASQKPTTEIQSHTPSEDEHGKSHS